MQWVVRVNLGRQERQGKNRRTKNIAIQRLVRLRYFVQDVEGAREIARGCLSELSFLDLRPSFPKIRTIPRVGTVQHNLLRTACILRCATRTS